MNHQHANEKRAGRPSPQPSPRGRGSRDRSAFTLIEMVVVIGIIAILITITVIAVTALATEAKLSSGKNKVIEALGLARAVAMETNTPTGVVFTVYDEATGRQQTEASIVTWAKDVHVIAGSPPQFVNRFVAVQNIEPIRLPSGIKVAGPFYGDVSGTYPDDAWITQPQFDAINNNNEFGGRLFGVLFDASGALITSIPESDLNDDYFDFNANSNIDPNPLGMDNVYDPPQVFPDGTTVQDETLIFWAPFLAVFNDDELREFADTTLWANDELAMLTALSAYLDEFADRIHFNRYTGVVMK